MSVRLQFEGIRCFSTPQDVPLRPLTLLVGENSSGKTTFLALCRLVHEIAQGSVQHSPFNRSPFFLGAFEQIATRRKRGGSTKSFCLTIGLDDKSLSAKFVARNGQASLNTLRLASANLSVEVAEEVKDRVITLRSGRGEKVLRAGFAIQNVDLPDWLLWTVMRDPIRVLLAEANEFFSHHELDTLEKCRQAIQKEFRRQPYAFGPIRTSPRRTYDPVDVTEDPEGSHIPTLLAMLSRSTTTEQWKGLEASLNDFGSKSGLFEEIEIISKGEKESDPFQVGVKSGGRVFNLIDVGYGVSQALPILVDVLRRPSAFELFLIQQPEVHLHPRAQAELGSFFAKQADGKRRLVIETHSDYLVDRVRMEVRNKVLNPGDVALLYFERQANGAVVHTLELDRDGSITNPPSGYRQFFLKEELSLLGV